MTLQDQIEAWKPEAARMGRDAGVAAASWVSDGNLSREHYERLARMFDDGDPALDDYLPARPNLSGEWADDLTPAKLFEAVTGLDAHAEASWNVDNFHTVSEALCDAWEDAAGDAFTHECERLIREQLA